MSSLSRLIFRERHVSRRGLGRSHHYLLLKQYGLVNTR
jgi:hypothetical protein